MLRRFSLLLNDMGSVGGGPVLGLRSGFQKGPGIIQPSVMDADIDRAALELKMSSLLARELMATPDGADKKVEPPLKRSWVRAPVSQLSTSVSRRDWFRLMSFNMMTDAWGSARTTPVDAVRVRVPKFTRARRSDSDDVDSSSDGEGAFCDYDVTDPQAELPPFLTPEFRRKHLVTLLRSYDPDLVCLNEVNRPFFNTEMWRYVRFLGYGTLYQSSRGARVRALRRGDVPTTPSNQGKIAEAEDIGNVVLFHKGRFFPLMMPGRDIGRHFHFAHIVGMRDRVTNMTLYIACVQLTAGDSAAAVRVRQHEARQVLTLLEAMARNDADRSHMTAVVCGDLNNQTEDEPCVELLRNRFFSAHDLVGGPRWTAWYHRDTSRTKDYDKYFQKNLTEMQLFDGEYTAEEEVERFRRPDTAYHGTFSKVQLVREDITNKRKKATASGSAAPTSGATSSNNSAAESPEKAVGTSSPLPASASTAVDQLALVKEMRHAKGIIYNTQDFIFYDPNSLALHQVLDVPDDSEVEEGQLLPNHKLPSHHLPLVLDVSWNDTFPEVLATSMKA
jgi:endonuclease/exonuclease/phosphatase family metal-dependent hydrolase